MRLPDDSLVTGATNDPGSVTPLPSVTPPPDLASTTAPSYPGAATAQPVLACDECGAPVDAEQRYCVVCGAHRRNVNDPATRYLSQTSAKSRRSKAGATARRSPQFGGFRGASLALVVVIALIPVAAAVGVIAGRSSNNDDSNLISALKSRQSAAAQTTVVHKQAGAEAGTAVVSSTHHHHAAKTSAKSKSPSKGSKGSTGSKRSKRSKAGSQNSTTASNSSSPSSGKIVHLKPTKSQEQQGSNVAQKVQKSTGKNFVNGQSSLPGVVVVK
jgi:hypothetical protein